VSTAQAGLPRELREAVAALERTVTGQLRDELAAAGSGRGGLAEELLRRRDDYRTWHRMDEVPDRVAEVAERLVRGEPADAMRRELQLAVLACMARAHEKALKETARGDQGQGQDQGQG